MKFKISVLLTALLSVGLVACNDNNDNNNKSEQIEPTPETIKLSVLGHYKTNIFAESAAEIPAYDAASKRLFVVNAQKGLVDVLDASKPEQPIHIAELSARDYLADSEVNSVAVQNGIVAIAVQAKNKTDAGLVVFFNAKDLSFMSKVAVGSLPDMLTFSPNGKTVLVANEAEPNDDYSIDPEGSVSIIDIRDIKQPKASIADFRAWNSQKADLMAKGVRIFGPNATVAQDLEPEYITISGDSKTAWVTLQENNAIARIDIAQQKVTDIYPLGYKDHGVMGNELDVSDRDSEIDIKTWAGLVGMYQPDSIANYQVNGQTYLVTANEGDSREWLKDEDAYFAGNLAQGYVENIRMKHLFNSKGFNAEGDYPAHLQKIANGVKGAKLNPVTFAYCGATATEAGDCRKDGNLGRLNIAWNMGYQTNADGSPKLDANGRLIYDKLYAYGARSFSIWNTQGQLVWDSGSEFEKKISELFPNYFNTDHEAVSLDDRSDNKGPEPEGITLGTIGAKTFAFIGLERMSGVMVYDMTTPMQPKFVEYFTTRNFVETDSAKQGDLGPEGLIFIAAKDSPNGKPLLVVGNEVSGSTAIYQVNVQ
ncbi:MULTISPECIES: choice-of-anchor I family protein [Acinetobacter]|uniref:choice-of-anchor I family protein n=1 Tax=Acinetobacter TaxID=469 RepID=UPI000B3C4AC3|nr:MULTISPECIES: choice-of-anchor I family protein [Acinetobacter]AWA49176.1 alkaline phosphatase [Acinetobacter junii]MCE6003891.1 choice-of-anchor I family protein [Acinetobacter junii]MDH1003805.1 choice-of-anchor I family protein [Acinetobacter junii]MDI6622336.1 choice-of-anchor I family protein [Acinetobacter junii]QXR28001.1 choice-of-anchor I family protein [Acinetobacter junii]